MAVYWNKAGANLIMVDLIFAIKGANIKTSNNIIIQNVLVVNNILRYNSLKQKRFGEMMTITIRTLAEKLNISITTVSRALDGYNDVAEETRQRVIKAAQELGYEPSFAARQLRRKRADAIGYILPTSSPQFADPFYTSFLTGLCDEAAFQNFDLLITSSPPDSEKEKSEYRHWIKSRRIDGIVLNRIRVNDWRVEYLAQNDLPFVSLGQGMTGDHPKVIVDERQGMQELVKHLIQKGHRRIAFIGGSPDLIIQNERFGGYCQGLESAGISLNSDWILDGDLTEQGGFNATLALLNQTPQPTAIIGCNDLTALGALRAAKERGIYIGTGLAIAGYDGIKETEYTLPPLTTVHQPTYEIARKLTSMLIQMIEGKPLEEDRVVIQPELIIRASTG